LQVLQCRACRGGPTSCACSHIIDGHLQQLLLLLLLLLLL
jgi:hypothetical protein